MQIPCFNFALCPYAHKYKKRFKKYPPIPFKPKRCSAKKAPHFNAGLKYFNALCLFKMFAYQTGHLEHADLRFAAEYRF